MQFLTEDIKVNYWKGCSSLKTPKTCKFDHKSWVLILLIKPQNQKLIGH